MKRFFIVHGWDGFPEEGWFPWLKKKLEAEAFTVIVPAMPHPEKPMIAEWVQYLSYIVEYVDEETFFVGHSIGCQTILRYLETLPARKKVGGIVFVAGWFTLNDLQTDEEKRIVKPWLETPIDFVKVKQHTSHFVAIFSDNDPVVPLENQALFEEKLGAKTLVLKGKGHFSGGDKVIELPDVLKFILGFSFE